MVLIGIDPYPFQYSADLQKCPKPPTIGQRVSIPPCSGEYGSKMGTPKLMCEKLVALQSNVAMANPLQMVSGRLIRVTAISTTCDRSLPG